MRRWMSPFRVRRRNHDRMLVLSVTAFNSETGWNRILNPNKAHENGD